MSRSHTSRGAGLTIEAGARAVEIPAPWLGRSWASSPLAPKGDIRVPVSLGKDALLTIVIQARPDAVKADQDGSPCSSSVM
jgi:hypothetical protein